jgi:hypothetical protein
MASRWYKGMLSVFPLRTIRLTRFCYRGERLPNSELYVLEKGYGHLAPAVKAQEVREAIDDFILSLDRMRGVPPQLDFQI